MSVDRDTRGEWEDLSRLPTGGVHAIAVAILDLADAVALQTAAIELFADLGKCIEAAGAALAEAVNEK